jgi:hypothetical protein
MVKRRGPTYLASFSHDRHVPRSLHYAQTRACVCISTKACCELELLRAVSGLRQALRRMSWGIFNKDMRRQDGDLQAQAGKRRPSLAVHIRPQTLPPSQDPLPSRPRPGVVQKQHRPAGQAVRTESKICEAFRHRRGC